MCQQRKEIDHIREVGREVVRVLKKHHRKYSIEIIDCVRWYVV